MIGVGCMLFGMIIFNLQIIHYIISNRIIVERNYATARFQTQKNGLQFFVYFRLLTDDFFYFSDLKLKSTNK
ncbi:hypothetical protein BpHYR1_048512 [Brachionus plicatilis]|uniref:Uncharacterized protein n=1 Tax=Brachionus plicatilis TaxID=10195 RepID=A0A3M7SD20_BRAPC|nr:hypothetical protein BpHYR1_048512 [Brachionus plicatilis]